jgi:hypothetical protein
MKKRIFFYFLLYLIGQLTTQDGIAQTGNAASILKITFVHTINKQPLILDSSAYTNSWNETFTVSKLSYYISNIFLQTVDKKTQKEKNSYHLINEEDSASRSFSFSLPANQYTSLSFIIGVDSSKNVSGAQTGALDPLNGMFWAWNSGYIMFKMEGNSPASSVANNKVEYHIGGFSGVNNVLRVVRLNLNDLQLATKNKKNTEIIIRIALDKIWNAEHSLKIADTPVCTTPGPLAASVADNYSKAFEVVKIVHY